MSNPIISFLTKIKSFDDETYFDAFYSFLLAPVILGVKPASILTIKNFNKPLYSLWQCIGKDFLKKFNLDSKILRRTSDGVILLIYSTPNLQKHLFCHDNIEFLLNLGHPPNLEETLSELTKRYQVVVPHECGIFLGIPRDDVEGYIKGKKVLFKGYWKVYCNVERAVRIFKSYDTAKSYIIKNYPKI